MIKDAAAHDHLLDEDDADDGDDVVDLVLGEFNRFDQRGLLLNALIKHDAADVDADADSDDPDDDAAFDHDADDLGLGEFNRAV